MTQKEIDFFIDDHWLEWTIRHNLSPLGHLTLIGKRKYIDGFQEEIQQIIDEFV